MEHKEILAAMVSPLCSWYGKNKRVLPWRENRDPYRVWVSEIMLQQTRVEAALPYFQRFLAALPTVEALAAAPVEQLMKLWEGLGYYSRVKNMQKAAQVVTEQYGGRFPADVKALSALPGIGDYTAGAVASIAFGLPTPAVDGNVLRVAARLCDDDTDIMLPQTKRRVKADLETVYPLAADCGDLTQAIMELGALVCVPGTPKCDSCPLEALCRARAAGRERLLPVREVKKEKKLICRTIFLPVCGDRIALVKRPDTGVLAGMWEFPGAEGHLTEEEVRQTLTDRGLTGAVQRFTDSRHVFTHLIWDMHSYIVRVSAQSEGFFWPSFRELEREIALPSAMKPFLQALLRQKEQAAD